MEPDAALIVTEPTAFPVASPKPLIVATAVFVDDQMTESVMVFLLPSL